MYLLRVDADVLAHMKQLARLETIHARVARDEARAAALNSAITAAVHIATPTGLTLPYCVKVQETDYRTALLWDDARVVARLPIWEDTQTQDMDRAYCMAHALPLRELVEQFLSMDWSPSPEIANAKILIAQARAPR